MEQKQFLWVERYRPQTIDECVLPEDLKETFKDMIQSGESQNLMFSGSAGTGKTTVARAICNELNADHIVINCSESGNIDTLRTTIRDFASTVSLNGGKKVVILDEFDYSNANSIQPALRGAIEEFADNCRFILTCNYKNRIIEPIHSRCTNVEFRIPAKEKPSIASQMMKRCGSILDEEGIKYDPKVLAELIMRYFPDFRRVINELQRYSVAGEIDVGILSRIGEIHVSDLMTHMKEKNFKEARKWVVDNLDNSVTDLMRKIYDAMYSHLKESSIPQAIVILGEYQYKAAHVADQEINLVACIVELMSSCEFK